MNRCGLIGLRVGGTFNSEIRLASEYETSSPYVSNSALSFANEFKSLTLCICMHIQESCCFDRVVVVSGSSGSSRSRCVCSNKQLQPRVVRKQR